MHVRAIIPPDWTASRNVASTVLGSGEIAVLSIGLSVVFSTLALLRVFRHVNRRQNTTRAPQENGHHDGVRTRLGSSLGWLGCSKLTLIAGTGTIHILLGLLAITLPDDSRRATTSTWWYLVAEHATAALATIPMASLSWYEHTTRRRTSLLLTGYLVLSCVLTSIRAGTAVWRWTASSSSSNTAYTVLALTNAILTFLLLVLESTPKRPSPHSLIPDGNNNNKNSSSSPSPSPEETSGLFTLATLAWIIPLIRKGNHKTLSTQDLYPLDTQLQADTTASEFQTQWDNRNRNNKQAEQHEPTRKKKKKKKKKKKNTSLLSALVTALFWSLLAPVPSRIAMLVFSFAQPFFIQALLQYLQQTRDSALVSNNSNTSPPAARLPSSPTLILASICIYTGLALATTSYHYLNNRTFAKLRSSLVSTIYQATLHLQDCPSDVSPEADRSATKPTATTNTTNTTTTTNNKNEVLTLMSTDIDRIERGLRFVHEIWANTLEVGLAAWLLQHQFTFFTPNTSNTSNKNKSSSFYTASSPPTPPPPPPTLLLAAPLLLILLSTLTTTLITHLASPRITAWSRLTATRVRLTNALISALQPLKIAGRESWAETSLLRARKDEVSAGTAYRWLTVASFFNAFVPEYGAPVLVFGLAMAMVLFGSGGGTPTMALGRVFASLAYLRLMTSPLGQLLQRVPAMGAAMVSLRRIEEFLEGADQRRGEYRVFAEEQEEEGEGEQVDLLVAEASDAAAADANVKTNTAVSLQGVHVGWTPNTWALYDLDLAIPQSQLTIITGPVASGKSTLCKALLGEVAFFKGTMTFFHHHHHDSRPPLRIGYVAQTPFLTNGSIRNNILAFAPFSPSLYDDVLETVLLKPDLQAMPLGDLTPLGSGGVTTLSGGQKQRVALARALYLCASLYVLDDFTVGLDTTTADGIVNRLFSAGGFLERRCPGAAVVWATHAMRYLPRAQRVVVLGKDGHVLRQGAPEDVTTEAQLVVNMDGEEEQKQDAQEEGIDKDEAAVKVAQSDTRKDSDQDPSRASTEASVYTYYLSSISTVLLAAAVLAGLLCGLTSNAGVLWLKAWAENSFSKWLSPHHSTNAFYLSIYAGINTAAVASLALYSALTVVLMARESGLVLHGRTADALIHAPLRSLTTMDAGVLVNYFSQDMNLVDMVLPPMVMNTFLAACLFAGQFVVIAIGTPWVAASYPVVLGLVWLLAAYYLRASRQLRLLELENKAPLYAHFGDTVRGIVSIRAFGWAKEYVALCRQYLDDSLRPLYLLQVMGVWLGLVLKLAVAGIAVAVTILATQVVTADESGGRAGFVGAGLVALMASDEMLNAIVQCWVQIEMSLGAVKRLKEFGERVGREERAGEDLEPDEKWPQKGDIVLDSVYASYAQERYSDNAQDVDLALRDLSVTIPAGQKVAIVGRTGSGKSSFLLLLLRLLDPTQATANNMTIDGLRLRRIHRCTLRERLIAIPQDVAFLAACETFKTALDPYARATNADCLAALNDVGLLGAIESAGGLDAEMRKAALSQGQQQLFSLAIAVLRARFREESGCTGGVLLLDEITANVDRVTEMMIMETIERVFSKYTVIAVTHSLESVRRFDRVLVMAGGRLVKEGNPEVLIREQ